MKFKFIILNIFLLRGFSVLCNFISMNNNIWNTNTHEYKFLKGLNWFGFETNCNVIHGLWAQNYSTIRNVIVENDFNAIRIPISLETALNIENTIVNNHCITHEPKFNDKSVKYILDFIFDDFYKNDIDILLDIHNENGIITEYPNHKIIDAWIHLLSFYNNKNNLIGIDIKNEPHGKITWPEWEVFVWEVINSIETKYVYNKLYFIEGIQDKESGWGNDFSNINKDSFLLNHPKIVFSPHVYGTDVRGDIALYQKENKFHEWFGFLKDISNNAIIIGEFGGKYNTDNDIKWHHLLSNYLIKKKLNKSFFYWCLNPNSGDTNGILMQNWLSVDNDKLNFINYLYNYSYDDNYISNHNFNKYLRKK